MVSKALLQSKADGLYCEAGGFHIDPWRAVDRAIITHAHSDHARYGSKHYLCSTEGQHALRTRLGNISLQPVDFGKKLTLGETTVSLHPAGHIIGSAQVRVEHRGEVWVVSGDYKLTPDSTCSPFEPVPCHTFITECTFGLPVYRWPDPATVADDLNRWWRSNRDNGRISLLYAYSLGKAQRVLSLLDPANGPIAVHGAVANLLPAYEAVGIHLPAVEKVSKDNLKSLKGNGLVVAPGSVQNTPWESKLGPLSRASASGWMTIRGNRRRMTLDRGFVLSDHCDWPGLLHAVEATGATRIGATHGDTSAFIRYLREYRSLDAFEVPSRYTGERPEATEA